MSLEWFKGSPEEFRRKIEDPRLFGDPLRNFLGRAVVFLQGLARENAPVDRGQLSQSITFGVDSSPMPLFAKVGTNKSYAPAMEYGTGALSEKPSAVTDWKFPTGRELDTWAKRHGFKSGYIVANIIAARGGLAPRRYLRRAFETGKRDIQHFMNQAAAEIMRLWRSG